MNLSRRSLILGASASLIMAPAIVRAASLMKVRPIRIINMGPPVFTITGSNINMFEVGWIISMEGQFHEIAAVDHISHTEKRITLAANHQQGTST